MTIDVLHLLNFSHFHSTHKRVQVVDILSHELARDLAEGVQLEVVHVVSGRHLVDAQHHQVSVLLVLVCL